MRLIHYVPCSPGALKKEDTDLTDFMIRFLCCNLLINMIVGILLIAKRVFKNYLTNRMQYNLWLLFLVLLALPFTPFRSIEFISLLTWIKNHHASSNFIFGSGAEQTASIVLPMADNWMNDFTLSVSRETPSVIGFILSGIWLIGILAMLVLAGKSILHLNTMKKSALPLQSKEVHRLF